jgi:hypothetical protein
MRFVNARRVSLLTTFVCACNGDVPAYQDDSPRPAPPVTPVPTATAIPAPNSVSDAGAADGMTTGPRTVRLLQANVGNVAVGCSDYRYKLCFKTTEDHVRESIASYRADIVALQEVVPVEMCQRMPAPSDAKVCSAASVASGASQVQRLLGPEYTVACDARSHFDCIGVRKTFAVIEGCSASAVCQSSPAVNTVPMQANCDSGFTASRFKIKLANGTRFDFVNAHLPSGSGAAACRVDQLERVFAEPGATLLAGDLNLDPYAGTDASEARFRALVGPTGTFRYHSGIVEHDPPHPTAFYLSGSSTFDHVVSNFAKGTCTTLGVAPATTRLDQGAGTDHRALLCDLTVP